MCSKGIYFRVLLEICPPAYIFQKRKQTISQHLVHTDVVQTFTWICSPLFMVYSCKQYFI